MKEQPNKKYQGSKKKARDKKYDEREERRVAKLREEWEDAYERQEQDT
jgi:hypothetical protein